MSRTSICLDIEENQLEIQKMLVIPLEALDLYLEFEYQITGCYLPATRFAEAEYPELEGGEITLAEISFEDGSTYSLNKKQIEKLENLLTKKQTDLMDGACWSANDKDSFDY